MSSDTDRRGQQPDYASLDLPDHEPKDEWAWQHRRAYIYRKLMNEGHHGLLNKTQIARDFDVSRQTIYSDLDKIATYIVEQTDVEWEKSKSVAVFDKAVKELLDEGEYKEAAQVRKMFDDWLEQRGILDREARELDVNHGVDEDTADFLDDVF